MEVIGVLEHHVDVINKGFWGITDFKRAYRMAVDEYIPFLKDQVFPNGYPCYPFLWDRGYKPDNLGRSIAVAVLAVNLVMYEPIKDSKSEILVPDLICRSCSNLIKSENEFICLQSGLSRLPKIRLSTQEIARDLTKNWGRYQKILGG